MIRKHEPKPETEKPIRVLIVDDHAQTREVLKEVMASEPSFLIEGEASGGEECLAMTDSCQPDIILLDVSMDGMNGVETARRLKEKKPDTGIIMVSNYVNLTLVEASLAAGADGYISKQAAAEELNKGIRTVHGGGTYVCRCIAQRMA